MTTVAITRRLPGVAFDDRAPEHDPLPRMDVATFAGFAARGPVHVPVPIEDIGQFETVFGGPMALALDVDRGRTVVAQLAPAVRLFFVNGGRRCWVIRLARAPRTNTFRVPGLLAPLELAARSPGSWSDAVTVSASLASRRHAAVSLLRSDGSLDVLATASPIVSGDLLRLTWRDAGIEGYATVSSVSEPPIDGPARRTALKLVIGERQWFDVARSPATSFATVTLPSGASVAGWLDEAVASPSDPAADITLSIDVAAEHAPRPGEVLTAVVGNTEAGDKLAFTVRDLLMGRSAGSPSQTGVTLRGRGRWYRESAPGAAAGIPAIERLELDLWARDGAIDARRVGELGLAPGHPRHLGLLPDDTAVFGAGATDTSLWRDAVAPRFPLAGTGSTGLCIPFGVTTVPEHYLPAIVAQGAPLVRDGLASFDEALFVDRDLADVSSTTLVADAEYLRFLAVNPRDLHGIHAAMAVEEASLIAVPDATQPGWIAIERSYPSPPAPSDPIVQDTCPTDDFLACGDVVGAGPVLEARTPDGRASVVLEWTDGMTAPHKGAPYMVSHEGAPYMTSPDEGAPYMARSFVLEESTSREWRGATVVFEGEDRAVTLRFRVDGDYYYRVRGVGAHPTEWSNGVAARVASGAGYRIRRPAEYRDDVLLAVHRALLRMCAARRDQVAILSLPAHYRDEAAAEHVRRLSPVALDAPDRSTSSSAVVPPLRGSEADALGFGALYHGWIYIRDERGGVPVLAPDGPAIGMIARRTNARGAWVAPANELLRSVVALDNPVPASQWALLQQLQINVLRSQAAGFAVLSADTLARDEDVRPINVRRLLILLRRLAVRLGSHYVFEPNDDAFRRMVQRGFEAMLGELFQRGAFAGATAASAFQVVTGESLNTPHSIDQGRFIVELRVAPSRPLTFLTVRLVQTGERVSVIGA